VARPQSEKAPRELLPPGVADLDLLHQAFNAVGLPTTGRGVPRITAPVDQPWGLREFVVVDPDGNLLRCLSPLAPKGSEGTASP